MKSNLLALSFWTNETGFQPDFNTIGGQYRKPEERESKKFLGIGSYAVHEIKNNVDTIPLVVMEGTGYSHEDETSLVFNQAGIFKVPDKMFPQNTQLIKGA